MACPRLISLLTFVNQKVHAKITPRLLYLKSGLISNAAAVALCLLSFQHKASQASWPSSWLAFTVSLRYHRSLSNEGRYQNSQPATIIDHNFGLSCTGAFAKQHLDQILVQKKSRTSNSDTLADSHTHV